MTLTEADTAESFYFGGAWRHSTGNAIPVINPADERVLASVPSATADGSRRKVAYSELLLVARRYVVDKAPEGFTK
jgi:hypothetical protein